MPETFAENFWGDKNIGFDVLYHNMKHGQISSKELSEFVKERAIIEETYSKALSKLSKQAANHGNIGTFYPFWQVIKSSSEKEATLHQNLSIKLQDAVKDLFKYTEEQHKKHRQVKDEVSSTAEVVANVQQITTALLKSEETYFARGFELEKTKKDGAPQKEIEKGDIKKKKAMEEYKIFIDKYANARNQFITKMSGTCNIFQGIEEEHLTHMKSFLDMYIRMLEDNSLKSAEIQQEFRANCDDHSQERLINMYATSKATGKEKPSKIEFIDVDLSKVGSPENLPNVDRWKEKEDPIILPPVPSMTSSSPNTTNSKDRLGGFLGRMRKRDKAKRQKKENGKDGSGSSPGSRGSGKDPEVDEEGYTIRPPQHSEQNDNRNSFYSSSDDDSDEEDHTKKINVVIRPLSNGAGLTSSVDELRAATENITLSPKATNRRSHYSSSTNQLNQIENAHYTSNSAPPPSALKRKPSSDLLDLDFSVPLNNAQTTTDSSSAASGGRMPSPVAYQSSGDTTPAQTPQSENGDNNWSIPPQEAPPPLPLNIFDNNTPTSSFPPIPPSSLSMTASNLIQTNSSLESDIRPRAQSYNPIVKPMSLEKQINTNQTSPSRGRADSSSSAAPGYQNFGSSRGPSPLTIGAADSVPIAAAFTETVNAYFKGSDTTKSIVKIYGDMLISFPAGILQHLSTHPNLPTLSFSLKNSDRLEQIKINSQLLTSETDQLSDGTVYIFNMQSLMTYLRKIQEQNPGAGYYNIDILKYQVKVPSAVQSAPLQLVSYWKCEPTSTDFRLDYMYNSSSITSLTPLVGVAVLVPVNGGVSVMQSKPSGTWSAENNRALWKLPEITTQNEGGTGSLRAKFDVSEGPSTPSTVALQFSCNGSTISGIDLDLATCSYRMSLVKKRITSGKYLCDSG